MEGRWYLGSPLAFLQQKQDAMYGLWLLGQSGSLDDEAVPSSENPADCRRASETPSPFPVGTFL